MESSAQLAAALSGRYDVEREIGAGGMATVYLARDVRHNRRVALKVLKPELGAVLGVERFLAEIEVTANLQHPNLLPLFDSGEAGGLLFYVMPFVEGESLRARLDREKQLPVEDAVRITIAVASALAYAHERGVIHRDLKPENILLQAGQPLIADFGIALAVSNAGGARITQTGLSLGTPHYMSPEQATGDRGVDGRADIYSLGSVLFEMLVGDPPHTASTAQAIIAKVLTEHPADVRMTRPSVPEHVALAIDKALEKLPADRWNTAKEFADALQGRAALTTTSARTAAFGAQHAPPGPVAHMRDPVTLSLGAIAAASIVALGVTLHRGQTAESPAPVRFVLTMPPNARPAFNSTWPAAASPDGKRIVFSAEAASGGWQYYIRRIDELEARPLPGTNGATQAVFSPDGKWLAFLADGKLRKLQIDGGTTPIPLTNANANDGADWTSHDEIILGADGRNGLGRVSAAGGQIVDVTKADTVGGQSQHLWPVVLDDGNTVVFAVAHGVNRQDSKIAIGSLGDGKFTVLDLRGMRPLGVVDGSLVYMQYDGVLMAARVDVRARRVLGSPVPLLDSIPVCGTCNGDSGVHLSKSGVLTYMRGAVASILTMLDSSGLERTMSASSKDFTGPRLSPDGKHIAVVLADQGRADVWIYDVGTQVLSRLTSDGKSAFPEWSPDGKRVLFMAVDSVVRSSIRWQPFDGGAPAETLVDITKVGKTGMQIFGGVLSPDGRTLVFEIARGDGSAFDVWSMPLAGDRQPRPYIAGPASETGPRFSPDGHWVAYWSDETGRSEVYVRSFPDPSSRIQISSDGGSEPVWSRDGKRLYYRNAGAMFVAEVAPGAGTLGVSGRHRLFEKAITNSFFTASYDVARDGQLLALRPNADALRLIVVMNWRAELAARMAASR
jgi:eukaryotic-like serine/threonine-protein kinase